MPRSAFQFSLSFNPRLLEPNFWDRLGYWGARVRIDLLCRAPGFLLGSGSILPIAVKPRNRFGGNFYLAVANGIFLACVKRAQWRRGEYANRRPQWLEVTRRPCLVAEAGAPRLVPDALYVPIPVTCPAENVPVLRDSAELLDYEAPPISEL